MGSDTKQFLSGIFIVSAIVGLPTLLDMSIRWSYSRYSEVRSAVYAPDVVVMQAPTPTPEMRYLDDEGVEWEARKAANPNRGLKGNK